MARAILAAFRWLLPIVLILAAVPDSTAQTAAVCSPDLAAGTPNRRNVARKFERQVRSGPLYRELTRRFGPPLTCRISVTPQTVDLSLTFRDSARLTAKIDSSIEFTEQRVHLTGLTVTEAIALLKRAESYAYGRKGCGIDWKTPDETVAGERAGSRESVYRGDTCNCQGRVIFESNAVAGLVLSSAC